MEKPRYPIGEQHFKQLREYGYIYVDKTDYIDRLLANRFYFLSRPRRFGKSLFLSTLEQFFLGNKEIFHGLAIEKADWNWDQFPVLRISFGNGSFTSHDGLEERMTEIVEENEERYQIEPKGSNPRARLRNLLRQLFKKTGKGVVILVDEYEKPLLDAYGKDIFDSTREKLSEFYSVFKDNTEYIRFLFITGITRFGQLNIFSGLNNLQDISLDPEYSAICGITEDEIRQYFSSGIENFAKIRDISIEDAFQALKKYYDGYHFSETLVDIYNPWALLNSLKSGMLTADWFASGSPNYLLKILRQKNYDLKGLLGSKVNENKLRGNGVDIMYPTSLLYQSGYLTIKDYDRKENLYTLGLPNFEVRTALLESIIPFYLGKDKEMDSEKILKLFRYLEKGEANELMEWLASYFSKISFYSKINFERDFQVLVLGIFLLIKDFKDVHCEYSMSSGRTDLVVEADKFVYVFEFKIGENADKAMEQIDFRGYDIPWKADGRKVFKIGAAFSTKNNGILRYKITES